MRPVSSRDERKLASAEARLTRSGISVNQTTLARYARLDRTSVPSKPRPVVMHRAPELTAGQARQRLLERLDGMTAAERVVRKEMRPPASWLQSSLYTGAAVSLVVTGLYAALGSSGFTAGDAFKALACGGAAMVAHVLALAFTPLPSPVVADERVTAGLAKLGTLDAGARAGAAEVLFEYLDASDRRARPFLLPRGEHAVRDAIASMSSRPCNDSEAQVDLLAEAAGEWARGFRSAAQDITEALDTLPSDAATTCAELLLERLFGERNRAYPGNRAANELYAALKATAGA